MEHEAHMYRAIALAQDGMRGNHGGPFGAVIVRDGRIVAEGFNRVLETNDPTAHAEVTAIRSASSTLQTPWLNDCDLYTSCEPCPMCLGASLWSRIRKIFYAATREDAAAIGFDDAEFYRVLGFSIDHTHLAMEQLLRNEAASVMREWIVKSDRKQY